MDVPVSQVTPTGQGTALWQLPSAVQPAGPDKDLSSPGVRSGSWGQAGAQLGVRVSWACRRGDAGLRHRRLGQPGRCDRDSSLPPEGRRAQSQRWLPGAAADALMWTGSEGAGQRGGRPDRAPGLHGLCPPAVTGGVRPGAWTLDTAERPQLQEGRKPMDGPTGSCSHRSIGVTKGGEDEPDLPRSQCAQEEPEAAWRRPSAGLVCMEDGLTEPWMGGEV